MIRIDMEIYNITHPKWSYGPYYRIYWKGSQEFYFFTLIMSYHNTLMRLLK